MIRIAGKKALADHHSEFYLRPSKYSQHDLESAIDELCEPVIKLLEDKFNSLPTGFALKFNLKLNLEMEKYDYDKKTTVTIRNWFTHEALVVLTRREIRSKCASAFARCIVHYDTFVHCGSGWTLQKVCQANVFMSVFRVFSGGCRLLRLPAFLRRSKAILAIRNTKDEKCFLHAVAMALAYKHLSPLTKKNPSRMNSDYKRLLKMMPLGFAKFPVSLKDVDRFEKLAPVSVNVFGVEKNSLIPLRVADNSETERAYKTFHVDLLLHKEHFYAIKNFPSLVNNNTRSYRGKCFVCHFCLSLFRKEERYNQHLLLCSNAKKKQPLQMPSEEESKLTFQNFKYLICAPFVVYADLESSITTEQKTTKKGKLISTRKHSCIAWAANTVCRDNDAFSSPQPTMYVGSDALDTFLQFIEEEFSRAMNILSKVNLPMNITDQDYQAFKQAKNCAVCGKPFSQMISEKVRDHCHLNGRYRQALCSICNLTRAKVNEKLIVFFHGLSNYDSHFIVQKLHKYKDSQIRVIPRTTEKYLSFSVGNIEFKDSYQFLADSLSNLVRNLRTKGEKKFRNVRKCFTDENQRSLLYQKGVFPYNYITSLQVLDETSLPSLEHFYNDLTKCSITEGEYEFAQKVWKFFKCTTLKDYLLVYLVTDVLTLSDVFESFRSNCIEYYELDPSHYFSNAHYTFDAFLRSSKVTLDLFTDVNMHLFVSKGIRGGLSMVSGKRLAFANNQYMDKYDPHKPKSFIIDFDCNNLYGLCMMDKLPVGEFEWVEPTEELLEHVLNCSDGSDYGFILECDLEYPQHLHEHHSDYPLAPDRKSVSFGELSPFAREVCEKHNLKRSTNTPKLMATLEFKRNYVLHYRTLKLYCQLGLVVKKVHNVIKFKQDALMKGYIEFNSKKRALSANDFDIAYFKFMNNSLFGKTMERVDNRTLVKLVNSVKSYLSLASKVTFKSAKIIHKDLVGVEMKHPVLKLNKPAYLGFAILDLAKYHMYWFHYHVIKEHFGQKVSLLYTDTDSLVYEFTNIPDIHQELASLPKEHFDFSNYPTSHMLYGTGRKKVPGAFKDEFGGKQIKAFVGLRSKMYCLLPDQEDQIVKVAKGVKKAVIKNDLKFDMYENCLKQSLQFEHTFHTISSRAHSVCTAFQNKISLSSFDDKRWLINPFTSVPYGHELCVCTVAKEEEEEER